MKDDNVVICEDDYRVELVLRLNRDQISIQVCIVHMSYV